MAKLDQRRTPFLDSIKRYASKDVVPFDVPGHHMGNIENKATKLFGKKLFRLDVNSPIGTDNLAHPKGSILAAEKLLADATGADEAFFLINGTSSGIIAMILAATFFYYMSYNAMTTNISRYADMFFGMAGGSYAIINIVTIAGGLLSYVPIANLSLKYGRKRMAVITSFVMVAGSAIIWLAPGFSPAFYVVFLFMGAALGGVDLCVYPMLLELCDANSVGRYSGYYYTVSMAAQVVTPILSGVVMDAAPTMLFAYITLMAVFMLVTVVASKHGDTILIDEVARREEAYEEQR